MGGCDGDEVGVAPLSMRTLVGFHSRWRIRPGPDGSEDGWYARRRQFGLGGLGFLAAGVPNSGCRRLPVRGSRPVRRENWNNVPRCLFKTEALAGGGRTAMFFLPGLTQKLRAIGPGPLRVGVGCGRSARRSVRDWVAPSSRNAPTGEFSQCIRWRRRR